MHTNTQHFYLQVTRKVKLAFYQMSELTWRTVPTIPPFSSITARTQRVTAAQQQLFPPADKRHKFFIRGGRYKHSRVSWQIAELKSGIEFLSFMPESRWCSLESGAPDYRQSLTPWHLSWSRCTGQWTSRPRWTVSLLLRRNPPDCHRCLIASSLPPWTTGLFEALFPHLYKITETRRSKYLIMSGLEEREDGGKQTQSVSIHFKC